MLTVKVTIVHLSAYEKIDGPINVVNELSML